MFCGLKLIILKSDDSLYMIKLDILKHIITMFSLSIFFKELNYKKIMNHFRINEEMKFKMKIKQIKRTRNI